MDTDVLVVGAGPTGLMLANQLVRRGVRTLIIDRHAGPARETRALGVQARTLEIYRHLGFVDRALALGKRATGANLWSQGRKTARVPFGDIGQDLSAYPFLLVLGQDDNERLLGDALRAQGVDVQWNTELVAFTQDGDGLRATLRQPDGSTREVGAAWVGGCDGARSTVRECCGIEFAGAPYDHLFFVADTVATGSMVADEINVYLWREGFHLFFPMRGTNHWRVVGILPVDMRGRPDLTFEQVVPSLSHEAGAGLAFESCGWFSTYRIHHRRAVAFRDGRCFVLGDAAHVHSPVGAQGMNTGLQDAYNLAWKLALVVAGRAEPALLDTYASERIPVAKALLDTTDRGFTMAVSDSLLAGVVRTKLLARVMAFAMTIESVQRLAFRTISQIGVRYPDSALSQRVGDLPSGAPRPGDRFPWMRLRLSPGGAVEDLFAALDDTRFTLLMVDPGAEPPPAAPSALAGMLDVMVIPGDGTNEPELARAGVPRPSHYLLRPDGYVGLCGACLDARTIERYVDERLRFAKAA